MRFLLATLLIWGAQASAQTACNFTTECFESEACSDTAFSLELAGDVASMITDFGDLDVLYDDQKDGTNTYFATGAGAFYLLSIAQSGDARLVTHMTDGPMAVSYLGTCEGLQ